MFTSKSVFTRAAVGPMFGAVLLGAFLHPAQAQATEPVQKPITIKLGGYFPTAGSGRDAGGSSQFSAGLDYALTKTASSNPVLPSLYFDYQGGSRNGGHADVYGLGVAVRDYVGSPSLGRVSPYVGAGLGIYDEQLKRNGTGSSNNGSFGGKLFAGVEFSQSFLVEVNYQILENHNGVNPDGFGAQLGYRF